MKTNLILNKDNLIESLVALAEELRVNENFFNTLIEEWRDDPIQFGASIAGWVLGYIE